MPELTPLTTTAAAEDVAAAFKTAAEDAGLDVTPQLLAVLLAQSALETGHWEAMYCFNFGNVKATDKWIAGGGSFTYYDKKPSHAEAPVTENLPTPEKNYWLAQAKPRTDGGEGLDMVVKHQRNDGRFYCLFWPSHQQARFRAFESLEDGAAAFLQKLTGRYRPALHRAKIGDVVGYVSTIRSLGYFTADLGRYLRSVQNLYRKYLPTAEETLTHMPTATELLKTLPDDILDRDEILLRMVVRGEALIEYVWVDLGNGLEIQIPRDAVAFGTTEDSVRIGTTAFTEQRAADSQNPDADIPGAVLLTPKLCDGVSKAALRAGALVPPHPQPINSTTAGYKRHSGEIDDWLEEHDATGAEVIAGWKNWCLSLDVWLKRGFVTNYDWAAPSYATIPLPMIASVSDPELQVVQGPHEAHHTGADIDGDGFADSGHGDYSQLWRWALRACRWLGKEADLADIYMGKLGPKATAAVSHEGALLGFRLPGVPLYGKADPENPPRITRRGEQGPDVVAWQEWLEDHGYKLPRWGADGDHGDETEAATQLWLKNHASDDGAGDADPTPESYGDLDPELVALDLDSIPFKQARHMRYGRDFGDYPKPRPDKPTHVTIHVAGMTETPMGAEALQNYAATMTDGRVASWGTATDNNSITMSVRPEDTAFHAGPANECSHGIEITGRSDQGEAGWADDFSVAALERTAALTAAYCERDNIPVRHVDPYQLLQQPPVPGITGHADWSRASLLAKQRGEKVGPWYSPKRISQTHDGWRRTSHLDTIPWHPFLARVKQYLEARYLAAGRKT